MYAQSNVKRPKTARDVSKPTGENSSENFQGVGRIEYNAENPTDTLCYHYYNASERIHGRTMEDWLKPCIYIGSGFIPSVKSSRRSWNDSTLGLDNYKRSIRALFELCLKLGIKFWAGNDRDIAPVGETFDETNNNLDQMTDLINEYQQKTGIKPLWIGTDLNSCFYYKNGAITNTEASVVAYAGYHVKRTLDVALKLGAENILIPLFQEGHTHLLNTDIIKEFKHMNRFLKLIVAQRDKIGYRGQLLIDVGNDNNFKKDSAYCNGALSTLCFLKHYNLEKYYKLNVNCGPAFHILNIYGCIGNISVHEKQLTDVRNATLLIRSIIEKGGINQGQGGVTFYLPYHDGPFESKDLIEAFITSIDSYAKALRTAVKLINDVELNKNIQMRYLGFTSGWGAKFDCSEASLEECESYIKNLTDAHSSFGISARYEHWDSILARYLDL